MEADTKLVTYLTVGTAALLAMVISWTIDNQFHQYRAENLFFKHQQPIGPPHHHMRSTYRPLPNPTNGMMPRIGVRDILDANSE